LYAVADVEKILKAAALPGVRKELDLPPGLADVYPFPADRLKEYAPDGVADAVAKADPKAYPVRAAALEAMAYMRANWGIGDGGLRESFEGAADDRVKKQIVKEQEPLAKLSLGLLEQVQALEAVEKKLADEKSPRWRAQYQYALAQARLRWAFLEEYNLSLGNVRTDSLQQAPPGANPVWRLVSVEKMKSKRDVKERADAAKELLGAIAAEHKGTPWEVLAKTHQSIALGLDWKLVDAKKE
jgi:hypothetical protein